MGVFSFKNDADNLGVLDLVPEQAAAAYSVRKLSKDYNGPAIRVRRFLDNAEQDIYFDGSGNLDTDSLLSFVNYSPANQLPLDLAPDAAAAYSFRNLSSSYVGPVVRVRRSSDNAEADFTAAEVTNGALTTWTGANNGFVVTWYDQSGNGRDQTQATLSYQILIVNAGALITDPITGKPAILGSSANLGMDSSAFSMSQPVTYFAVNHRPTSGNNYVLIGSSNSSARLQITELITNSGEASMFAGITFNPSYSASENRFDTTSLIYALFNTTNSELGVNGVAAATGSVGTYSSDNIRIGQPGGGSAGFTGYLSEVIIYDSDKSADRTNIEFNINSYYNIYSAQEGYVATWYDQSGSGNDAAQATSTAQPKIVGAGVLVEENGKPALDFDGANDDLQSIGIGTASQPGTWITVSKLDDVSIRHIIATTYISGNDQIQFGAILGSWRLYGTTVYTPAVANTNQNLHFSTFIGLGSTLYQNSFLLGTSGDTGGFVPGTLDLKIGANRAFDTDNLDGKVQEAILYLSDQSANRTTLESNINNYFKIY